MSHDHAHGHGRGHGHAHSPGHGSDPERLWHRQEARLDLALRAWDLVDGKPGWRVADVGCGPGRFTLAYAQMTGPTGHVHAVDVDERALAFLRDRLDPAHHAHVATELLDITRRPLPDLRFHAVFCTEMLHHVSDVPVALRNLRAANAPLLIAEFDPSGPGEIGPPLADRLAPEALLRALKDAGWQARGWHAWPHESYAIVAR